MEITKKEYAANVAYLEEHGIKVCGLAWEDRKRSAEMESYTDAGGDMIINLEVLSKECFSKWIDGFDINEEVMLWWSETRSSERKAKGLPFSNIKEHYEDLEAWVRKLREICDGMPY